MPQNTTPGNLWWKQTIRVTSDTGQVTWRTIVVNAKPQTTERRLDWLFERARLRAEKNYGTENVARYGEISLMAGQTESEPEE